MNLLEVIFAAILVLVALTVARAIQKTVKAFRKVVNREPDTMLYVLPIIISDNGELDDERIASLLCAHVSDFLGGIDPDDDEDDDGDDDDDDDVVPFPPVNPSIWGKWATR